MENNQKPLLIKDLGIDFLNKKSKQRNKIGLFLCSCGKEFKAIQANVENLSKKSCGCKRYKTTHGLSRTRIYHIWHGMIQRTSNKNNHRYSSYGERGIVVCEEWNTFEVFSEWSFSNGYKEDLSIDRINNDGNYEPSNCRWVDRNIQARNTKKIRSHNTSGFRGVSFHKKHNKWTAQICINAKLKNLGLFKDPLDAAKAYDNYVVENNLEHTINFS